MGIEKTLQEHSSMLTRVLDVLDVRDDTGPLLEEAVTTIEELMELDQKLQSKDFAIKWLVDRKEILLCYFTTLPYQDSGQTRKDTKPYTTKH